MFPQRPLSIALTLALLATGLVGASAPVAAADELHRTAAVGDGSVTATTGAGAGTLPLVVLGGIALVSFFQIRRTASVE